MSTKGGQAPNASLANSGLDAGVDTATSPSGQAPGLEQQSLRPGEDLNTDISTISLPERQDFFLDPESDLSPFGVVEAGHWLSSESRAKTPEYGQILNFAQGSEVSTFTVTQNTPAETASYLFTQEVGVSPIVAAAYSHSIETYSQMTRNQKNAVSTHAIEALFEPGKDLSLPVDAYLCSSILPQNIPGLTWVRDVSQQFQRSQGVHVESEEAISNIANNMRNTILVGLATENATHRSIEVGNKKEIVPSDTFNRPEAQSYFGANYVLAA
ncbi:MAG: hypothetical protein KDD60_00295 [Bdellovibrionales bacterium]|nr:hypothetical protein [Bdellovibrionales bacterium]